MRRQYIVSEFRTSSDEFIRQVIPKKTDCVLRFNGISTAHLTVKDNHPVIPALVTEDGVRAAVHLVTIDDLRLSMRTLVEGRVGTINSADAPTAGTVSFPVVDDFEQLALMLGWQAPGAPISGQGAAEYARYTGPSETNVKAAIAANAARLGKPWDVAPSLGRGTVAPLELRMHALSEKLLTQLTQDRLRLTLTRNRETGRYLVDVDAGDDFPRPITPQSGVLGAWSWVKEPPTMTRVVVGGRGEGIAREFALVIDAELEEQLGVILEGFVDARNGDESEPLEPYGLAELAKHRGAAGLEAQLREASWFRFPDAYDLGTRLNIQIGALPVQDVVTEIEITHDVDSGLRATPRVGLATADPQLRLVKYVQNVATAVRGLERR